MTRFNEHTMKPLHPITTRQRTVAKQQTTVATLCIVAALSCVVAEAANRTVDERRAADPRGSVEIINTSGRVTVTGWDRPEVVVTGSLEEKVERLDFTTSGGKTVIRVVQRGRGSMQWDAGDAVLEIRVPRQSALNVSLVSADLVVRSLQGEQRLSTVSGDIDAELSAEASARSVSGDLTLAAKPETKRLEINSVSGDVTVTGRAGGRVDVRTVSGDAKFSLGSVEDAKFKSVSGDLSMSLALEPAGRFAAESVSGLVKIDFATLPAARFELRSFTGDIDLCPAVQSAAGAADRDAGKGGRSREFRNGNGEGRVDVQTMSGEIRLCAPR